MSFDFSQKDLYVSEESIQITKNSDPNGGILANVLDLLEEDLN